MANTRYLTTEVENWVRGRLEKKHGQPFSKLRLPLTPGGSHEFDAVSEDGRIVASIKSASGLTAGGRVPTGKIKDSLAELYYLNLVDAPERYLILTTPAFHEIFLRLTKGAIPHDLTVLCIPLPLEMQELVDAVVRAASSEVTPAEKESATATEVELTADD